MLWWRYHLWPRENTVGLVVTGSAVSTAAVAGIAVAKSQRPGIVGICPSCSLIPIKMLGDGSGALSADIIL